MSSAPDVLLKELSDLGVEVGLDAVGVAGAEPFEDVRTELVRRRAAGLHAGMQFTFRNPNRSTDPGRILSGARSLVVGARRTPAPRLVDVTAGRMRIAAYARHDYYAALRSGLEVLADRLRVDGWKARVVADDNALVDRAAAVRAGIGWWGRNSNVLIPGRGSWFVLGSVVTDALLPVSAEVPDGCGACRRCLDGCPTGAILDDGVVDARRCLAWLVQAPGSIPREFREALGGRLYGCDDCQEVCPVGRAERVEDGIEDPAADVEAIAVLEAADDELMERFGRWYVAERDPRYLRRNALVALGNTGSAADPSTVRMLNNYLSHHDSLLRAHAVWAASRLGRSDLLVDHPDRGPRGDLEVAEELRLSDVRVGP
ncbi:MAG TPA: tRNA epoxyqueuosine(34) reductase QueG [Acidimicrobiaceae bacterium]|nr:tRNA epoxyqueuosine(34) reductase QueG [Acidimicrobiaceae bacterium]